MPLVVASAPCNPWHSWICPSSLVAGSCANAFNTRSSCSRRTTRTSGSSSGPALPRRISASKRRQRRLRRNSFAMTRRATPHNHPATAAHSGTTSSRPQATRKVSAAQSAAVSASVRRRQYAYTCRWLRSNRSRYRCSWLSTVVTSHPARVLHPNKCPDPPSVTQEVESRPATSAQH